MAQSPVYPSPLHKSLTSCPMSSQLQKFIKYENNPFFRTNQSYHQAVGTAVHSAIQDSFEFLGTVKKSWTSHTTPGSDVIEKALKSAISVAEESLRTEKKSANSQLPYIKQVIRKFGTEYLNNPDMIMHIEEDMVSQRFPGPRPIGGKPDAVFVDLKNRMAHIVDWKNVFEHLEAEQLGQKFDAHHGLQPMFYSYLINEKYAGQIDEVKSTYAVFEAGANRSKKVSYAHSYTRKAAELSTLPKEISVKLAEAASIEQIIYDRDLRSRGREALVETVINARDLMSSHNCPVSQCQYCPMRFNCTLSNFARYSAYSEKKLFENESFRKFEKWASMAQEDLQKYSQEGMKIFDDGVEKQITKRKAVLRAEAAERGEHSVSEMISSEADRLRASYEDLKYHSRRSFVDSLTDSAAAAHGKLPFSMLGEGPRKQLQASWMTQGFRRSLEKVARERISEVTANLGIQRSDVEERILRSAFMDQKFAKEMQDSVISKSKAILKKNFLRADAENFMRVIPRYDLYMDKEMVGRIMNQIDTSTVSVLSHTHYDQVHGVLSQEGRKLLSSGKMSEVVQDLKGHGVIMDKLDDYIAALAKRETLQGIRNKIGISSKRFPVGMSVVASFLTYIAGTVNARKNVENKMRKGLGFAANVGMGVDDGTHSAAATVLRRLLHSDFGSAVRKFNPKSMRDAEMEVMGYKLMDDLKEGLTSLSGHARAGASEGMKIPAKIWKSLTSGSFQPGAAFFMAAAGAAAFFVLAPRILTNREIGEKQRRRKNKLKRIKESRWNQDSMDIREPQSDLRSGYKLQGAFGSPWSYIASSVVSVLGGKAPFSSELGKRLLSEVGEYVSKLTKGYYAENIRAFAKSAQQRLRQGLSVSTSSVESSEMVNSVKGIVSRLGRRAGIQMEFAHVKARVEKDLEGYYASLRGRLSRTKEQIVSSEKTRRARGFVRTNKKALNTADKLSYLTMGTGTHVPMPVIEENVRKVHRTVEPLSHKRKSTQGRLERSVPRDTGVTLVTAYGHELDDTISGIYEYETPSRRSFSHLEEISRSEMASLERRAEFTEPVSKARNRVRQVESPRKNRYKKPYEERVAGILATASAGKSVSHEVAYEIPRMREFDDATIRNVNINQMSNRYKSSQAKMRMNHRGHRDPHTLLEER